ncbi:MAG: hypothetical protein HPY75_15050 [Actinobacteria bacterium]|nr:hypothetical protein [Actinomycetota bacterium]
MDDLPGLSDTDVSTTVSSDKPVVAERAMYFDYQGKAGGSCSQGYSGYVDPVFAPQAKILSQTNGDLLQSVSEDLSTFVFKGESAFLDSLQVGDILVAPPLEDLPNGMLKRVKSIERSGDKTTINTEQASLADALKQGEFTYHDTLTADDIADQGSYGAGIKITGAYNAADGEEIGIELDDVTLLGEGDAKITLSGKISVITDIDCHVDIGWSGLREFSLTATADQQAELSIFAGLERDVLDEKIPILPKPILFKPITFFIGWFPVVITPAMQLYAGVDGSVHVGLTASVGSNVNVTAGVAYSNGDWGTVSGVSTDFDYEEPTPTAGCKIKPYVGPRFMLLLYGVAGPYAEINAFLELDIDVFREPWWILYGGVEANIGVQLSVLDRIIADKDFPLVVFKRIEVARAAATKIKVVLTWEGSPPDLDSHLTGPLPDGSRFHMYYPYADSNDGSPWPEIVRLDLDDIDGYGPEMTTVLNKVPGTYRFSVHDYTNRFSSNSYALSNSGATVKLYMDNNLAGTFYVPRGMGGTLWTVFEISGNTVTPINSMSYEDTPEEITSIRAMKN